MRGQDIREARIREARSEGGKTLERQGVRGGKTLERKGVRGARH